MQAHEIERRLRSLIDRIWNQGDLGAVHEMCHRDVALHCPHCNELKGVRAYQEYAATVLGMFPDLRVEVHEVVASENRVTLRYTWSGAFAGGLTALGYAPPGSRVSVQGVALYHLVDGQIILGWASEDWLSMYQQLGLIPSALSAAA